MCGIFGIHSRDVDVANLTYFGLFALQHRGQESAGIAVGDGARVRVHRDMGLVAQVFSPAVMAELKGVVAIGHTRYSTTGSSRAENAHPLPFCHPLLGQGAIAHNGNLINSNAIRRELEEAGAEFESGLDTEVMARLIEHTHGTSWDEVIKRAFARVTGAFSCAIITVDSVIALRDPYGFRPLCLGFITGGGTGQPAHVVASETCALDTVNARFVRDVQPGEMVIMDGHGVQSIRFQERSRHAMCVFEFIYFARPDSILKNCELEEARLRMGRELAAEAPVDADMVIPLPDSGTPAAIGYAEAAGIPFREGLTKSRYINRTFIQPDQSLREAGVLLKLNPLRRSIAGKRVIAVDDSIVRDTPSRRIHHVLRRVDVRVRERVKPLIAGTQDAQVITVVGPFAGLYRMPRGGLLAASADGVGTKIKVAVAAGRHRGIGLDLVNHCVNDIATAGARPLFFLDYFAAGQLEAEVFTAVMEGLAEACQTNGCALLGGETAEMPGLYAL